MCFEGERDRVGGDMASGRLSALTEHQVHFAAHRKSGIDFPATGRRWRRRGGMGGGVGDHFPGMGK